MKSEPDVFGIDHLERSPDATTSWGGVRNYQARNLLRDEIAVGDRVLFYHSSCKTPGVVGTASVVRAAYPDPLQFDPGSEYHDPASSPDRPRWYAVDVRLERKFDRLVSLAELRETAGLEQMVLLRRSRLSVQPVTAVEWERITRLGFTASRDAD
jgi:predicted RNA-binding protein with PUA-like domain